MGTILAAMQPYFIPHLPYFELANSSNVFVLMDNFPVAKRRWVKSNFFYLEGAVRRVSIPLVKHSDSAPIGELEVHSEFSASGLIRRFDESKRKQEGWREIRPTLEAYLDFPNASYIHGLQKGFVALAKATGVRAKIVKYSELQLPESFDRNLRLIELCRHFDANTYLNNASGIDLYDGVLFGDHGILLKPFNSELQFIPDSERPLSFLEYATDGFRFSRK